MIEYDSVLISYHCMLENGIRLIAVTTQMIYCRKNQLTHAGTNPSGKKTYPAPAVTHPRIVTGAIKDPINRLETGEIIDILRNVKAIRGSVKTWAASVMRRFSPINFFTIPMISLLIIFLLLPASFSSGT